jgi:hypothetical protein
VKRRRAPEGALRLRLGKWAHLGSNQGPLACEASALPLSYAPSPVQGSQSSNGSSSTHGTPSPSTRTASGSLRCVIQRAKQSSERYRISTQTNGTPQGERGALTSGWPCLPVAHCRPRRVPCQWSPCALPTTERPFPHGRSRRTMLLPAPTLFLGACVVNTTTGERCHLTLTTAPPPLLSPRHR